MEEIKIGRKYKALLNGEIREFIVIEPDAQDCYWIRWDDGDEEWVHITDISRWIETSEGC
mgnify:CR=1 FL=1